ncbi:MULTISPECIES: autotransporter assembly complex protein TamA [Legionella]|uniref:Outer membrane protein n=1 Tax=Legionella drozanskii LLAP-1 TaxID=1212489 RepID=A0A0W0SS57_9GAMM|nr:MULTISPECIES: BamA/TamA family outer membrane protein [Legionella]KTC85797.1 outer membrane protein [Legionella drozanskii LLAP-1]PJE16610.1 MAG: outer membrane protein assembly factor [Legionella sp.]
MKKIRLLWVLISLPFLIAATPKMNFHIIGVKGKLLTNIQSRLMEVAQTRPLERETDEELRQQITQAMQPFGYFNPLIILRRQPLQIQVIPGSPMLISNININLKGEGASNPEVRKELNNLPIAVGQPLNSAKYEETKQRLSDAAERQGYLHSSFEKAEMLIDINNNGSQINLIFDTGPQYYFGQVKFDPTNISPELLNRYVPFNYGLPYSTDQILTFNTQLVSSGYFRSVAVKPEIGVKERYIPVHVHLEPVPRSSYSFGVGYGTDTGPRGRAGYHIVPLNRAGHKFNLMALGSFAQSALKTQYIIPGKNPVVDQYHINSNLSALNYDTGYSKSVLISLAQHHNLPYFQRVLSINGLYDDYHYYRQPEENKRAIFPKASFTWINIKNNLFSPSGYNINVTGLGASKAFLSNENFLQASINAKAALSLPQIRTRFYFHTIQAVTQINNINKLPLSLALLLGGAENLKAYKYNSIGPGKILTYGGLEIQKETKENWYLIGFLDSGDVYRPKARKMKNDIGIGLMWLSAMGPIKVGIALPLGTQGHHSKSPKLVINMGPDL